MMLRDVIRHGYAYRNANVACLWELSRMLVGKNGYRCLNRIVWCMGFGRACPYVLQSMVYDLEIGLNYSCPLTLSYVSLENHMLLIPLCYYCCWIKGISILECLFIDYLNSHFCIVHLIPLFSFRFLFLYLL